MICPVCLIDRSDINDIGFITKVGYCLICDEMGEYFGENNDVE